MHDWIGRLNPQSRPDQIDSLSRAAHLSHRDAKKMQCLAVVGLIDEQLAQGGRRFGEAPLLPQRTPNGKRIAVAQTRPPAQPAKATPFAGGNATDVRRNRPAAQPAKATPFAGGNATDVRRNRFLRFRPID
ncbi:MAG: hypothetical protein WAN26_12225 [Steroidobacteraceae bacterium]